MEYPFTNGKTGKMISEIKRAFTGAVRDAGLEDLRFHDLRPTFATRLNAAGADPITIRDLPGHSSTTMTETYTHTSRETRRKAVKAMSDEVIEIATELVSVKDKQLTQFVALDDKSIEPKNNS